MKNVFTKGFQKKSQGSSDDKQNRKLKHLFLQYYLKKKKVI